MPIPLVAIEEHYEAFFVWHHARDAGWLAETNNILLHVDDHADLRLPVSRERLPERHDAHAAARHAYTRLNIANFIWPTVYAGVFDKVYWLRRQHEADAGGRRRVTLSFDPDRLPLAWTKSEDEAFESLATVPGEVACEYAPIEPGDRIHPAAPLALDIDLDYFATNNPAERPASRLRLEEGFAREILDNPYHWMRVEGFPFHVEQDPNGYWVMDWFEEAPRRGRSNASPPAHALSNSLQRLGAHLDEFQLEPALITICRSEYSGFTPKSLVRQIEEGVRDLLMERYTIEERLLNDLLPARWKVPQHLLRSFPW